MRGADSYRESLFSTIRLEDFVSPNHPLRAIRIWMNDTLAKMDEKFSAMYEADIRGGRPPVGAPDGAPKRAGRGDADADGKITFAEFSARGAEAFARADANKDGTVTIAELQAMKR
mgnify:CR=1 FL=1